MYFISGIVILAVSVWLISAKSKEAYVELVHRHGTLITHNEFTVVPLDKAR